MSRGEYSQPQTIVITESNERLRRLLTVWLENDGNWKVDEASGGRETLNQLDETVDMLLLSRQSPGLTAPKVLARLDQTGFDGPVVVLSSYEADARLNEDTEYVAAYLMKPIEKDDLLTALDRASC